MREIKFRAWDGRKMFYDIAPYKETAIDIDDECCNFWHEPPDAVMQYTGLKDKNGKEIYEGDIVTGDNQGTLDTVIFASGCFCLERAIMHYEATYWGDEVEVKGNIYENGDLLDD